MTKTPPDYRVGYKSPPLHSRFKKGQSGNPLGARLHRPPERSLAALIEAALDRRVAARPHRPATRRGAIVAALVDRAAAGDLRAIKLLLDLIKPPEPARDPEDDWYAEDPREAFVRAVDRVTAEKDQEEEIARRSRDESVCD